MTAILKKYVTAQPAVECEKQESDKNIMKFHWFKSINNMFAVLKVRQINLKLLIDPYFTNVP